MSTKEELLYLLEKQAAGGKSLSGEQAAAKLGVSRVAVWKAAEALREDGFSVTGSKGEGYRLESKGELCAPRIRAHLPPELEKIPVFTYEVTDSTNNRAKAFAAGRFSGCAVFAADAQSAGRGRLGRSFYSPARTGLYFSFLFSSDAPLEVLSAVTPYAAVAVSKALEEASGKKIGVKWVNDLYLDGRKICGILTEAVTTLEGGGGNVIVVGVGINLGTMDFPEDLKDKAGALGALPDRSVLAARLAKDLASFARDPYDRSFMEDYAARSIVIGKKVSLNKWSDTYEGTVLGFDGNGGIILDINGEKKIFNGGEISLKLK